MSGRVHGTIAKKIDFLLVGIGASNDFFSPLLLAGALLDY
jgi:hypothetical protein